MKIYSILWLNFSWIDTYIKRLIQILTSHSNKNSSINWNVLYKIRSNLCIKYFIYFDTIVYKELIQLD